MPSATVIIVNFNGAHLLPACLDGLEAQRPDGPDFDTIVVDNASVDGSLELLARDYPWVQVIASPENLGFAGGNNLALREVSTRFAVLLNNDAIPERRWLKNLLAPFDRPDSEKLAVTTGKIHFMPRYAPLSLETAPFIPGAADSRELGVVIKSAAVEGADVFDQLCGDALPWGAEAKGKARWRWTRPKGDVALPVPPAAVEESGSLGRDLAISLAARAPRPKSLSISSGSHVVEVSVVKKPQTFELTLERGLPLVDVINNVGNIVYYDGYGADRGFCEIDHGQFEEPTEVFAACGNGMAIRTDVARDVGFFDDDFFMYYEDLDLSWRLRSRGWEIRYIPDARLRHIHAASSVVGSPRFMFNVERNRLLTLTKNAPAKLAMSEVRQFLQAWLASAWGRGGDAQVGRYPVLGDRQLARSVVTSYFRLLPRMLRKRRSIRRRSTIPWGAFDSWSVRTR